MPSRKPGIQQTLKAWLSFPWINRQWGPYSTCYLAALLLQDVLTNLRHTQGFDLCSDGLTGKNLIHAENWLWSHSVGRNPSSTITKWGTWASHLTSPCLAYSMSYGKRDHSYRVVGWIKWGNIVQCFDRALSSHKATTHFGLFSAIISSSSLKWITDWENMAGKKECFQKGPTGRLLLGLNSNQQTVGKQNPLRAILERTREDPYTLLIPYKITFWHSLLHTGCKVRCVTKASMSCGRVERPHKEWLVA